jgi:hypothetical protein
VNHRPGKIARLRSDRTGAIPVAACGAGRGVVGCGVKVGRANGGEQRLNQLKVQGGGNEAGARHGWHAGQ